MDRKVAVGLVLLVCVSGPAVGRAAEGNPKPTATAKPAPSLASQFNIDAQIDRATDQLTRRYNLNAEQNRGAREILHNAVYSLIEKHETEVRRLLGEIVAIQFTGKTPTAEQAQNWAERTTPIYEDVKAEILKGNETFHESLTDEQKKQHDSDMAETRQSFTQFEEKLTRWRNGGFTPEDWYPNRRRTTTQEAEVTVSGPARGPEHFWAIYTRNFIRDYELDPAQTNSANSILGELTDRATKMRASRSAELKTLEDKLSALMAATPPDSEALQKVLKQRQDLMKPVNDLFGELKERLNKLPRDAQRAKFTQRMKDRASDFNRSTSRPADSQPVAVQPAPGADQPAEK